MHHVPVLGINRGRLGFLTDINPNEIDNKVTEVLNGHYIEEKRFLLNVRIQAAKQKQTADIALNDVVLLPGDVAHMIEFSITINDQFVCNHRADGMIVATPTGSTAYALSGGGPILHPSLDALVLVPMFPHTLSARPIVVGAASVIQIKISDTNEKPPRLSCDGQKPIELPLGAIIEIQKNPQALRLIHPTDYNYFETLRLKLQWNTIS
jgi:NAD+ kinase